MRSLLKPSLRLYTYLASFSRPRSFAGKLLLVAFLGTHVPLLTLLAFFVGSVSPSADYTVRVAVVAVVATLLGTAATLFGLHRLLAPVLLTQRALREYVTNGWMPSLPSQFTDEAGALMADTQHTIRQLDSALHRMAHYDDVTGLPNGTLFLSRAVEAAASARRDGRTVAILVLQVERTREVGVSHGRVAADALMRGVAQRLSVVARESDVLARVSETSFALLDLDAGSAEGLLAQARRFSDALSRPLLVTDSRGTEHVVHVSVAIGIATFPGDAEDAEAMLQHAQSAVGDALTAPDIDRDSTVRFYSASLHIKLQERLELERDLRLALERGEFFLEYQPKVSIATGETSEVEALVRWQHPTRGVVSPLDFIPVAEATGLIVPLGAWVLKDACMQARAWMDAGQPYRVAVNLSAQQVARTDVVALTRDTLAATGLPAQFLELEITESLLVADVERATRVLTELRALGVTIALDDFGTGYSSLSYLRNLPVDVVKIDRSFVRDLGANAAGDAVVNAVLAMAQGLSLQVVAEGVETASQLAYLRERGCGSAQGYLFARPLAPAALEQRRLADRASAEKPAAA